MEIEILNVDVNLLGIVAGVAVSTALGFFIYSEAVLGKQWRQLVGLSKKDIESKEGMGLIFGNMFLMSAITSLMLSIWVQYVRGINNYSDFTAGIIGGFTAALFPLAMISMNYLFARKSPRLLAIDGGNILATFLIIGLVVSYIN